MEESAAWHFYKNINQFTNGSNKKIKTLFIVAFLRRLTIRRLHVNLWKHLCLVSKICADFKNRMLAIVACEQQKLGRIKWSIVSYNVNHFLVE